MLVSDFLQDSAARAPNKVALICDGQRLTYAQVERQANQMAHGLLELGVQRGERIAVWLHNSAETVIAIFAILKVGGTFTVINPTTKLEKLAYVLDNCTASGLFAPGRQSDQVDALFVRMPSLRFTVLCGKGASEAPAARRDIVTFPQILGTDRHRRRTRRRWSHTGRW